PAQGIITAIIAGVVTAFLGGSRVQVSGPTGAFIVIIYGIVQKYGVDGLATATLIAGFLLIAMGLARFGGVLQFIPFPVTVGFTSGIALIIATGQIPAFLGLRLQDPADWVHKIALYAQSLSQIDLWTLAIGAVALFISLIWPRFSAQGPTKFFSRIPGSLVAILVTTITVRLLDLPVLTIGDKFGQVPSTFPHPHLPAISWQLVHDMFPPALTIAMLAGIESLLSAVVADGMTGHKHRPNMELIAQGAASIVSPIFGGIPSTGAIARTATNIRNGARSPVSAIVHSLVLLLIMLFFGHWASYIPMATLAAILLIVAYNMSEWRTFLKMFKAPKSDWIVLLLTFSLTVLVDLTVAIQVGVVAAAILFIRRMGEVTQVNSITKNLANDDEEIADPMNLAARQVPNGVVVYEVFGSFFFGAVEKFKSILSELETRPRVLIIRMRAVLSIDSSGLHFLEDMIRRCQKEKVRLILSGVHMQPTMAMTRAGLLDMLGEENFAANIDQALNMARAHLGLPQVDSPIVTKKSDQ
ncbi:MAG TPA: SulP family inorganic anion transporter, partial [Fibrobacteraceae bacterium]|nr:SulP family inorganic anion transporter [Fibrobacteraceae bacterium]